MPAALTRFPSRSLPPPGSVPVPRPMPSCGFAPAFLWLERAPLQGFDPRTELPAIVERSQVASTGFPSRVFSSAALAHGFDPGPSSRALSASSTCVGTACGAPESCVAAESACRFRLPTLMGSSTSRSRGFLPPRPIPVLKDRRARDSCSSSSARSRLSSAGCEHRFAHRCATGAFYLDIDREINTKCLET